jgi:hypothetical protein
VIAERAVGAGFATASSVGAKMIFVCLVEPAPTSGIMSAIRIENTP